MQNSRGGGGQNEIGPELFQDLAKTKLGTLYFNLIHNSEMYGQIVAYYRAKNRWSAVPCHAPTSRTMLCFRRRGDPATKLLLLRPYFFNNSGQFSTTVIGEVLLSEPGGTAIKSRLPSARTSAV